MHELCGARRVTLTEPRRAAADPSLFYACAALIADAPSREANAAFVAGFSAAEPRSRALAFLNATSARFNREQAMRVRRKWRWLVYDGACNGVVAADRWQLRRSARASSEARVYPLRAPLIAVSSVFVKRGTRCTLKSIEPGFVCVAIDAGGRVHRVPRADFAAAFDLAYCVTIHRSQCDTIDEPFVVLDTRRILALGPAYARALLYVAASRATRASFVSFA
jgi:hypothetical protein